jgi:serralysin
MKNVARCCMDVYPPDSTSDAPETVLQMAMAVRDLWKPNQTILVKFLGGTATLQAKIMEAARIWTEYANIKIEKAKAGKAAHVRISLNPGGSWSYIGTGCMSPTIAQSSPTMNFGWLHARSTRQEIESVVLHEWGHALGCIHEHQSPEAGIPWDKPVVYRYYQGSPNYWSRKMVDDNIFNKYAAEVTNSNFDPESIMQYPVPEEHTKGQFMIPFNWDLSQTDKSFISGVYPGQGILRQVAEQMILKRAASPIIGVC